ncbi:hypothetical protein [Methylocystis heyeri]|uniref:DUF805 domain-containing protein n=1 Tax=Methylocystis heyeri TaxID=391905 RepID=A0A6B8KI97_9HYPH|nr:hypothetical protein [Methylocystis heyeri]QGM47397.1 hypothetical protein H2LOC_017835 [Methylocystis heyeri]
MADWPSSERIRFLFRSDQGRVDRDTWRRGALSLLAVFAPFLGLWLLLEPYTNHDLSKTPLFDPVVALAYSYLIFFAIVGTLIAVSLVNLSAKRFRDLGRPAPLGLASLAPFAVFLDGAARWLQVRVAEIMPHWQVYPFDAAAAVIVLWTIYELGFSEKRSAAQ